MKETKTLGVLVDENITLKNHIDTWTRWHPRMLLKENADLITRPISDILNCSYREGHLPTSWKEADIVPIPKCKLIQDINKHLRLISLTPTGADPEKNLTVANLNPGHSTRNILQIKVAENPI